MKKALFFLLFITCFHLEAQDSIGVKPNIKSDKIVFTDKDIIIDTAAIAPKYFDKNFKEKYKDTPFIYEYKPTVRTSWDRFIDWLGDLIRSLFLFSTHGVAGSLLGIIFKIIMFGIIFFVIYLITKAILNKEGQWVFGKNSKKIIEYWDVEQNLHSTDFEKLITNCLVAGENRLTIRYYYLWLLKKMSDRELIIWDIEKTNSDYLYELKNQLDKSQFEYLSYLYNYIWYGEFDFDQDTFNKAKTAFENAIKNL